MTGLNKNASPRRPAARVMRAAIAALALLPAVPPGAALLAPAAFAQDYAPVAIVNDEIVTGYDVTQRQALLKAASGGEPVTREQAVEQLIDDTLRLQAARKAGIVPTEREVDAGFDELARAQGRDPETMRRYFRSQGISDRHLDNQIATEVAWRALIPRTYMPRVRISDDEIEEAMGKTVAGGAVTENQYLLSEIRIPVGAGGQAAATARATAILGELQQGATFGDVARRNSSGSSAALGGDLGWTNESSLSPAAAAVVPRLGKDRVSTPFLDGNDIVLIGVRDTRSPSSAAPGATPATYRLSQLVVGVAPDAAPTIASIAQQRARAAKTRITDCASIERLKGEYLPISGDIGALTPDQMPGPVREAVATLAVGGISEPIRSNDGFHVIVVCDKREGAAAASAAPDETRMRNRLTAVKLARYSASLMRKLRREAVIERR